MILEFNKPLKLNV